MMSKNKVKLGSNAKEREWAILYAIYEKGPLKDIEFVGMFNPDDYAFVAIEDLKNYRLIAEDVTYVRHDEHKVYSLTLKGREFMKRRFG